MKNLVFLIMILLLSEIQLKSQDISVEEWNFRIDTSAFDGISKQCYVAGKSDNVTYNFPIFAITGDGSKEPLFYLKDWIYGGCDYNRILAKFDNESNIYQFNLNYIAQLEILVFSFQNARVAARYPNKYLTRDQFISKLRSGTKVHFRLMNKCSVMDAEFTLFNAKECIDLM